MIVPDTGTKKLLEKAVSQYEASLEGSVASLYLTNRQITKEVARDFRLGFVENPLPGHEAYHGKLCIPYLTPSGVVDVRFRTVPLDGDPGKATTGAKYLSMPGAESRPYNLSALARPEQFIVICEGEFDTITAHMCGIPSVGFPGAQSWKNSYWRLFRYRRVAILADNDDHGEGHKFGMTIVKSVPRAVIISMPEKHDVNSFYIAEGREALRARVGLK